MSVCIMLSFQKIRRSEFIANILTLSFGSIISQVIPIVSSVILARLYSPEDFGLWGVFSSYASILAVIGCFRYEIAIVKPKRTVDVWNLTVLSTIFAFTFSAFWMLFIVLDWSCGLNILNVLIGGNIIFWLPLYVFVLLVCQIISNVQNRFKLYASIAHSSIFRSLLQVVVRMGMGVSFASVLGLVIGAILGTLGYLLLAWRSVNRVIRRVIQKISVKQMIVLMKEYVDFPKYDMFGALLNTLSSNVPIILLALFFTKSDVGFFSMAINVLYIPMSFIGTAIGRVYYQRACEMVMRGEDIASLTRKIFQFSFYMGWLPVVMLILWGEPVFNFVLGEKWGGVGIYAEALSLWFFMGFCTSPLSCTFLVLNKQKIAMNINIAMFISRIAVILLGGMYLFNVNYTVLIYGILGFILSVIQVIYVYRLTGLSFSLSNQWYIGILVVLLCLIYTIKICMRYV